MLEALHRALRRRDLSAKDGDGPGDHRGPLLDQPVSGPGRPALLRSCAPTETANWPVGWPCWSRRVAVVFAGLVAAPGPAFANLCLTNPDACGPKPAPPSTPRAVANLTVSSVTQTQATLSWQDTSANEDSFTIIRRKYVAGQPEASTVTLPAHPGTGPMTWTDTGLDPDTNYQWFVASTLNGNWSTRPPYV